MSIVVFGSVFVDIKGYPSGSYLPGGRNAGKVEYVHGGVGRNIAEDLANLELRPVFVSLVDDSGISRDVVARLSSHKVDTRFIPTVKDGLGTWLAVFDDRHDVCASISHRPDMMPLMDVLAAHGDEIFAQADSVLLELDLDVPLVKEILRLSEKHGKRVYAAVSNITIALERRDFFQRVSCFVCNQAEADAFFTEGFPVSGKENAARDLAARIRAARVPSMVVTLGGDGAVWATAEGMYGFCPAHRVPVLDTTGAGDAFFAGVAAGLTYGKSLPDACAIGSRLAASVVSSTESTCPRFLPGEFGLTQAPQNV